MGHSVISNNALVLRQLTRSLNAVFRKQIEKPTKGFELAVKWFMESNSTSDSEDYNWLGSVPAMKEWIDARPHSKLSQFGQTIKNHNYANGIEVPMDWIDDDKLGQTMPRIKQLSDGYFTHVFAQFLNLLESGTTDLCYDGSAFYATDHSEDDSGTQYNYTSSGALSDTNVESAWANMIELKDDKGELLHITPTHLWSTPAQRTTLLEIVKAGKLSTGADNMNQGLLEPMIIPGLATSTWWGILDLSGGKRPFIKQNRRKLDFHAMDKADDEMVYNSRIARYGADYRGGYGYGFWQTAFLSTGT